MSRATTEFKRDLESIQSQIHNLLTKNAPWTRFKLVSEFSGFPTDVAAVIADYLQIFKLRDWIPEEKLDQADLLMNPEAFLAGLIPDWNTYHSGHVVANPFAIDHIKYDPDRYLCHRSKWENPKVVEWLFSIELYPRENTSFIELGYCKSTQAIDWILNNTPKPDAIKYLSANPMAIDVLRQNMDLVNMEKLWGNSAAVDILQARIAAGDEINWEWLSWNSSAWAIDLLENNQDKIHWPLFSENPSIFEIADHPNKKELMKILTGDDTTG